MMHGHLNVKGSVLTHVYFVKKVEKNTFGVIPFCINITFSEFLVLCFRTVITSLGFMLVRKMFRAQIILSVSKPRRCVCRVTAHHHSFFTSALDGGGVKHQWATLHSGKE